MTEQPSEGALVIAALLPALSEQTSRQLRALLADDLATADALAPRAHRLVGIAALIDDLGRVPSIAEYERARVDHAEWPHPSTLGRAYGSWLGAVRAAVKMTSEPSRPPGPRRPSTLKHTRADCVNAVLRCAQALGDWPASNKRLGTWKASLDAARAVAPLGVDAPTASARA